jgi:hypothetical protein
VLIVVLLACWPTEGEAATSLLTSSIPILLLQVFSNKTGINAGRDNC